MGERWPTLKGRQLDAILRRVCGEPVRQTGSHRWFISPTTGRGFTFAAHDRETVPGGDVRRTLVARAGLTPEQARKEISR